MSFEMIKLIKTLTVQSKFGETLGKFCDIKYIFEVLNGKNKWVAQKHWCEPFEIWYWSDQLVDYMAMGMFAIMPRPLSSPYYSYTAIVTWRRDRLEVE